MKNNFILSFLACLTLSVSAQQIPSANQELGHLFVTPKNYVVGFTETPPVIDGIVNEELWEKAVWSDLFRDIEGDLKPEPYQATRVKMLWDKDYLYIAADLEEKHIWANLTEHDQIVFFDNDFEVFLDPANTTHRYFEYEVNAVNTIFDLFLPKPYRAGSGALISWDSKRLKHAVQLRGTLNNPNDEDSGWTVEMAIPFADVTIGNDTHIPKDGEIWRINFSRVQWETEIVNGKYAKKKDNNGKVLPENNWVWSPQGVIDMHRPERWGYLQFSKQTTTKNSPTFKMPYSELQRQYLWLVFYKQHEYKGKNGTYANSLKDLGINEVQSIDGTENKLYLESTTSQFTARIVDKKNKPIHINQEGYVN